MTLPTGDSAEENFDLKESTASNRLDFFVTFCVKTKSKERNLTILNPFVSFLSREKVKKETYNL
jgi:hypothetical protein